MHDLACKVLGASVLFVDLVVINLVEGKPMKPLSVFTTVLRP